MNISKYKSHLPGFLFHAVFLSLLLVISSDTHSAENELKTDNINNHIEGLLASEHVKGEIIVRFRDEAAVNETALKNASKFVHSVTGGIIKKKFKKMKSLQLIKMPENSSMRQALRAYLTHPLIKYAEPNYIIRIKSFPDDEKFNNLWGLHNTGQSGGAVDADIDAPEAWDITTGSESVIIAVVDTGVAINHPDLIDNIWRNSGETDCSDGVDNDANGYEDDCFGWDFLGDDNDPSDLHGHGTHVSGTIAGKGNNMIGVAGVMWEARIMPLRFLGSDGFGTTADAIEAILYANNNGAHVINNSWGGSSYSKALKDAIDASTAVVVCAAGNDGVNTDISPHYPSGFSSPNIISVAATTRNDERASFSNFGLNSVDIGAPGVSIHSTLPVIGFGSAETVFFSDFDGATGNLTLAGWQRGGSNTTWAITDGTGVNGSNSLEDSPSGNYTNNTMSWAGYMTPVASVNDSIYTLSFDWKGELESNWDYLDILFSPNGLIWYWIDYLTGSTNGTFVHYSTNSFSEVAETFDSFYVGFGLASDASITRDGVYIDNVSFTRKDIIIGSYTFGNFSGTSMAAPHVSGVAGLIKALRPELSNIEIKNAILDNVDPLSSLAAKTLTGGRLNAFNVLSSLIIDTDGDGIPDDGDGNGMVGDNPCMSGNTVGCDDNCVDTFNPDQTDFDRDGVGDLCDNCTEIFNPGQTDSNSADDDNSSLAGDQHYGNVCDPDFDNDGLVTLRDFSIWRQYFRQLSPPAPEYVDLDGNGFIGLSDFSIWRKYYRSSPGPGIGD
jgi:subtilisin family serine protease